MAGPWGWRMHVKSRSRYYWAIQGPRVGWTHGISCKIVNNLFICCSGKSNVCGIVKLKRTIVHAASAWLETNGQNQPIMHHIYLQSWDTLCIG